MKFVLLQHDGFARLNWLSKFVSQEKGGWGLMDVQASKEDCLICNFYDNNSNNNKQEELQWFEKRGFFTTSPITEKKKRGGSIQSSSSSAVVIHSYSSSLKQRQQHDYPHHINMINLNSSAFNFDLTEQVLPISKISQFRKLLVDPILPYLALPATTILFTFTTKTRLICQLFVLIICIFEIFQRRLIYKDKKETISLTKSVFGSDYEEFVISMDVSPIPDHQKNQSTIIEHQELWGLELELKLEELIHKIGLQLNYSDDFLQSWAPFLKRLLFTIIKVKTNKEKMSIVSYREDLLHNIMQKTSKSTVKPLPSFQVGFSVLELFSGIGGMRLALPKTIRNIPIRRIVAIDINKIASKIYDYNFHQRRIDGIPSSQLKTSLIESLKAEDIDGKYDIWTMSPPCQPFTTTKNSNRLDHLDNRSKGFYHLMQLLFHIKARPRWIVLENVKGFIDSEMYRLWITVLMNCNYQFQEFLLSPDSALQIPNSRPRYYCVAEYNPKDKNRIEEIGFAENPSAQQKKKIKDSLDYEIWRNHTMHGIADGMKLIPITIEEMLLSRLNPLEIQSYDTHTELSIHEDKVNEEVNEEEEEEINLVRRLKRKRFRNVSSLSRFSSCFTKGYGNYRDSSTGSTFLTSKNESRYFHPNELLALFGFPREFKILFSDETDEDPNNHKSNNSITLQQCYACIGNSVNVKVVQAVMNSIFASNKS